MPDRPDSAARLVFVTAPDLECARTLARTLVEERLAACVNLLGGVESIYRWEGAVQDDAEVLLLIKTTRARLRVLEARLVELHPYDVPECVAVAPERVEARYLAWLLDAAGDPS